MDKSVPRSRDNAGHSLEVLPDLCPHEVDMLANGWKGSDSLESSFKALKVLSKLKVRRGKVLTVSSSQMRPSGPSSIFTPTKPSVLFYDGRPYNQLSEHLFALDPCKYYRNIQPFEPQHPISFMMAPGNYPGLGKPPVRKYFKLTQMRVNENRIMPSYELLDRETMARYYKNSV